MTDDELRRKVEGMLAEARGSWNAFVELQVITGLGDEMDAEYTSRTRHEDPYWPFERGEILVTGYGGREPIGEERKPSKWAVVTETAKSVDEALAIRKRVLETTDHPGS